MTSTKIKKWGNSLAVRLPLATTKKLNLVEGSHITIEEKDNGVLIKVAKHQKKHYELEELVSKITKDNIHPATDWGPPQGKEIW